MNRPGTSLPGHYLPEDYGWHVADEFWQRYEAVFIGGSTLEQQAGEKAFWERLEEEKNKFLQKKEKLSWICSYTPVEIISACGLRPYRFPGREGTPFSADSYLHSSLCFFARCSLERVLKEAGEGKDFLAGMVLVNSCISMLHFYHALEKLGCLPFVYLLDLPRDNSEQARHYYADNLRGFHQALSKYYGCESNESELWKQIYLFRENRGRLGELYAGRNGEIAVDGDEIMRLVNAFTVLSPEKFSEIFTIYRENILRKRKDRLSGTRLFITGSIVPEGLTGFIRELGGVLVLDDLCTGRRMLQFPPEEPGEAEGDPYSYLARLYLERDPRPRMQRAYEKLEEIEKMLKAYHIDGVIFYYLKFCDPWYYYGQLLKEKLNNIPLLVLEGALNIVSFSPEVISALITSLGFQNNFLEEAESRWWSRDNCSFHRCAMGGLFLNYYPVPAAFCASSHLCEGGAFMFNNLARRYNRPFILLDTPLDNNGNALLYVTRQLQKMIILLEGVAGTRLRAEKLEEAVLNTEKTRQAMFKVNEIRRHPHSPLRSKDAFAYLYLYFTGMGSSAVSGIYETLAAELEKKIKESQNSKRGEKSPRYRLLWLHLLPFYQNGIMDYLEANGAELVFEDFSHVYWESGDTGRPLEYIANRMLSHFNYGRIERRIKVIKELARRYNVDGIIYFSHWGCRQSCGSLNLIRNSLQEIGLPFLVLDGDCVDSRNYASGQVQTRIDGFLEMLA